MRAAIGKRGEVEPATAVGCGCEGENDEVDEQIIATTLTIGFCDCTIPIRYT
jgi:hypothetical protein